MKKGRWLVFGILGLVLAVGMSGCKIISALPDPSSVIEMKPGDKQNFKVVGPVNTPTTICQWTIRNFSRIDPYREYSEEVVSVGKNEFELNLDGDCKLSNKKNIIACECFSYQFHLECMVDYCYWDLGWVKIDSREWVVRINQNSDTIFTGNYIIEDDSDLQSLKGYSTVTGSLIIGPDIKNLEGLDKLTNIGGNLIISQNKYIENFTALESITSIGGLDIYYNTSLKSLSGLENITSVNKGLSIVWNSALASMAPLENITSVGGILDIRGNDALTTLGMTDLQRVNGDFEIYSNPLLCKSLAEELRDQVLAGGGIGGETTIVGNKDCTNP